MPTAALLIALSALCGCGAGEGAVFITVGSSAPLKAVDHLRVVVEIGGQSSQPTDIALLGGPVEIPPARTFQLRFEKDRSGAAILRVEARDAAGHILAAGTTTATIVPSKETTATLTLSRGAAPSITSVTPAKGPTTGATTIAIVGDNFVTGAEVTVDGVAATSVVVVSPSKLTAATPARPGKLGTVPVVVTNPDQQAATAEKGFEYFPVKLGFGVPTVLPMPDKVSAVKLADLNGDGKLDLIVAVFADNGLLIFHGRGDGSFENPTVYPLSWLTDVEVADFDRDGTMDVVVPLHDQTTILFGQRDGSLRLTFGSSDTAAQVGVADFNLDGKPDLVLTNNGGDTGDGQIRVLLGDGDGHFRPAVEIITPARHPTEPLPADLNRDGAVDLIVAYEDLHGVVWKGNGSGFFTENTKFDGGIWQYAFAAADFDGDGKPDVAAGCLVPQQAQEPGLRILLGNGDNTLRPGRAYLVDAPIADLAVADLDGNGTKDLVTVGTALLDFGGYESLNAWVGSGDGSFGPPVALPALNGSAHLALGDLNGDGKIDLVVGNSFGKSVSYYLNTSE